MAKRTHIFFYVSVRPVNLRSTRTWWDVRLNIRNTSQRSTIQSCPLLLITSSGSSCVHLFHTSRDTRNAAVTHPLNTPRSVHVPDVPSISCLFFHIYVCLFLIFAGEQELLIQQVSVHAGPLYSHYFHHISHHPRYPFSLVWRVCVCIMRFISYLFIFFALLSGRAIWKNVSR